MNRTSVGIAALIAAVVIGLLIFSGEDPEPAPETTATVPAARPPEPPPAVPPQTATLSYADPGGENRLAAGERIVFSESALAPGQPVVMHLLAPAPPEDVEALPVRVLSTDGRQLETEAAILAHDRGAARLEFDAAFLSRGGRYLVELKTKEATHFPVRRYVIEVR